MAKKQKKGLSKMEQIKIGCMFLLLFRTVYTDTQYGKIENPVIGIGYVLAFLLAYCEGGILETVTSIKASLMMILILFILFILKGLGGGDIKLFSVIAAFYPEIGFQVVVLSYVVAGIFIFIRSIYRVITQQIGYPKGETIHFSFPIAAAFCFVFIQSYFFQG